MDDQRFADCACFNAHRAARLLGQLYDRALKPSGLSNTQFSLLAMANARGPLTMTDLAAHLGLERTTLSRNLGLLERRGFIRLVRLDGRSKTVHLTTAGAEALAGATPHWRSVQDRVTATMGRSEWPALLAQLHTLHRRSATLLATTDTDEARTS